MQATTLAQTLEVWPETEAPKTKAPNMSTLVKFAPLCARPLHPRLALQTEAEAAKSMGHLFVCSQPIVVVVAAATVAVGS